MTDRAVHATTFLRQVGWADAKRALVAGDASNRRYDRLTRADGHSAILMDAPSEKGEDVRPFVKVAEYLLAHGLSAPKIYEADKEAGFLLIEDLGNDLFAQLMARDPAQQLPLYRAAIDALVHLHQAPVLSLPLCDANWLVEMTAPVFEYYASATDTDTRINTMLLSLAQTFDSAPKVTILRDFHAENLLWLPDRDGVAQVGLLDFQDALQGHPAYDLVSILQDARRDVATDIEAQMIAHYLLSTDADPTAFKSAYALLGVQRNLRILGIFARLCLRDGKTHYVDLIPRVWGYVMRNLADPSLHELANVILTTLPEPTPKFLEHLKSQCAFAP